MNKKIFQIFGVIVVFSGCASAPDMLAPGVDSPEKTLKKVTINSQSLELGSKEKGELDKKDFIIEIDGYKTPADCYSIYLPMKQDLKISVKSLGHMIGFSKTIMFPVIEVYNEMGEKLEGKYETYEKVVSTLDPISILAEKKYKELESGKYNIIIFSDMKTNERLAVESVNILVFPVKIIYAEKTEYAKYRITAE